VPSSVEFTKDFHFSCMIGKSRMKGEKIVTNLVPYGPEKPRSGMVKNAGTDQVNCHK